MTIRDFLALNLRDAERRLSRLTEPVTDDQRDMWRLVDDSTVGRMLAWFVQQCDRARPASRTNAGWRRAVGAWEAFGPAERMRLTGATVLVAAGVHVAQAASAQPVGGWWLILPGIAGVFGVTAITLSFLGPPAKGRD